MTPTFDLTIEKPAAGGRMLARHDGQVVLVSGAIPGERVRVEVERRSRQVVWAKTVDVIEASADRRPPVVDPACGGMAYAHIAYGRQLDIKAAVVADAFRRIGKIHDVEPISVAASPEQGYRLRARFRLAEGRAAFLREGSHETCAPAGTGQMRADSLGAVDEQLTRLGKLTSRLAGFVLTENVRATERVLHLEPHDRESVADERVDLAPGVTGVTAPAAGGARTLAGHAAVRDTAATLFTGPPPVDSAVCWSRRASSFFQGNRFLTGELVSRVLDAAGSATRAIDLYAGVGLFAVALASRGVEVAAVEGERSAAGDLRENARPWASGLHVIERAVEHVVHTVPDPVPEVVIVDPPRTGLSREALDGVARWGASRIVYVSCDPPTLARDARLLGESGYGMSAIEAFDLFPNTPHVESVAVFDRGYIRTGT